MSRLLNAVLGVALGFAASAPLIAADTANADRTEAWSESQVDAAMDECNSLPETDRARCIVNIRPAGGGRSFVAVGGSDENTVKTGYTEDEYTATIKKCEGADDRDRCIANAKDQYGRM
jgi:hypothetical protein